MADSSSSSNNNNNNNNNNGGQDGSNNNNRRPWDMGRPHCRTCGKAHSGRCWHARGGQGGQVFPSVAQHFGAQGNSANQLMAMVGAAMAISTATGSNLTINNGPTKNIINSGGQRRTNAAGGVKKPGKNSQQNFLFRERRRDSRIRSNIFHGSAETVVDPEEMLSYGTPGQPTEDPVKKTDAEDGSHIKLVPDFFKQAENVGTAEGSGIQPMDTDQDTATTTTPTIDKAPVKAQLTDEQEMWAFHLRSKQTGHRPKDAPWSKEDDKRLCTWFIDRMVILLGNPVSSDAYAGLKTSAEESGRPLVREAMISSGDLRNMFLAEHTGDGAADFLKNVGGAFPAKK